MAWRGVRSPECRKLKLHPVPPRTDRDMFHADREIAIMQRHPVSPVLYYLFASSRRTRRAGARARGCAPERLLCTGRPGRGGAPGDATLSGRQPRGGACAEVGPPPAGGVPHSPPGGWGAAVWGEGVFSPPLGGGLHCGEATQRGKTHMF